MCLVEVMECTVTILPNIIAAIFRPHIHSLVIVGTPTITHAKLVAVRIVGIVNVADGNRHTVTAKSDIAVDPHQIAVIIINIARTSPTCRTGRVIPIIL